MGRLRLAGEALVALSMDDDENWSISLSLYHSGRLVAESDDTAASAGVGASLGFVFGLAGDVDALGCRTSGLGCVEVDSGTCDSDEQSAETNLLAGGRQGRRREHGRYVSVVRVGVAQRRGAPSDEVV